MILAATLAVLVQAIPPEPPSPDTSAYLDPGARELVRHARERRARVEERIDAYTVTGRERVHVGLGTTGRQRTIYSQETAARIEWRRGETGSVQVLGARSRTPMVRRGAGLPDDLDRGAAGLAFDPDDLQLGIFTVGFGVRATRSAGGDTASVAVGIGAEAGEDGEDGVTDPLRAGSEAHYRFRSGDTTVIRLPDGSAVRLLELRVIPRRRDYRLVRGSIWLDAASHGIVRTVFESARPFDLRRDAEAGDLPLLVRAMGPMRATVRFVTVEYGLWQGQWWLPRLVAADAVGEAGVLAEVPIRFERSYDGYRVTAAAAPADVDRAAAADRGDGVDTEACRAAAAGDGTVCRCTRGACRLWRVNVPADTAALLASAELPPPLADGPQRLITGEEVASLAAHLGGGPGGPGELRPEVEVRAGGLDHLRYNRVEGLAVGAGARVSAGGLAADATAWLGLADREPKAEVGVARETLTSRLRLAGYRRMSAFDEGDRAHSLGGSLSALLLGRDETDYLLASGAELTGGPVRPGRWAVEWRLFAEHQHPLVRNTDVSLARAWGDAPVFGPVRPADRADQAGVVIGVRGERAAPSGFRWSTGARAEARVGTFDHLRGTVSGEVGVPLGGRAMALVGAAAGTTAGDVPVQGLWYLGGPASVRGYPGAFVGGEAFWRGRAELATATPAARLALFGDAGWAGSRTAWARDPTLLSAGVGASVLDGLIRADLARALRGRTGWRLELYLDAGL